MGSDVIELKTRTDRKTHFCDYCDIDDGISDQDCMDVCHDFSYGCEEFCQRFICPVRYLIYIKRNGTL